MKTFKLMRHEDVKEVSGTGIVAVGIDFGHFAAMTWISEARILNRDGTVTMHNISTLTMFNSVEDIQRLHGHGSRTDVLMDEEVDSNTEDKVKALIMKQLSNLMSLS